MLISQHAVTFYIKNLFFQSTIAMCVPLLWKWTYSHPLYSKLSRFKDTAGHGFLFLIGRVQKKKEGFDQQNEIKDWSMPHYTKFVINKYKIIHMGE